MTKKIQLFTIIAILSSALGALAHTENTSNSTNADAKFTFNGNQHCKKVCALKADRLLNEESQQKLMTEVWQNIARKAALLQERNMLREQEKRLEIEKDCLEKHFMWLANNPRYNNPLYHDELAEPYNLRLENFNNHIKEFALNLKAWQNATAAFKDRL